MIAARHRRERRHSRAELRSALDTAAPADTTAPPFTAPHIPITLLTRARRIAARTREWFQNERFNGFPATERVVNQPGFASLDVSLSDRFFPSSSS
jgi:hypothetical protein